MCHLQLAEACRTLDYGPATFEPALRKATEHVLERSLAARFFGKNHRILDREAAAVGDVRGRSVRGVADQNHASGHTAAAGGTAAQCESKNGFTALKQNGGTSAV
jgi:hypothetical protein